MFTIKVKGEKINKVKRNRYLHIGILRMASVMYPPDPTASPMALSSSTPFMMSVHIVRFGAIPFMIGSKNVSNPSMLKEKKLPIHQC